MYQQINTTEMFRERQLGLLEEAENRRLARHLRSAKRSTEEKVMGGVRRAALLFVAAMAMVVLSSTVALAITKSCEVNVVCFGTMKVDTLNGSSLNTSTDFGDYIYGRGGGDTLNGLGGTDYLYGQGGADKLFGGSLVGNYFVGGPGNDALSGEGGPDVYYFGPSWGKDSITDDATNENRLVFLKGPAQDEQVPVSDDLTIKLVPGTGPEVKNASGISTIDWQGVAIIEDVFSGSGDDRITGNFEPNYISAGAGADNISSGGGNDLIYVADGSGDDVVDCGETLYNSSDEDRVYFDSGDQIATNCEIKLSAN